jgi:hypothetical protein
MSAMCNLDARSPQLNTEQADVEAANFVPVDSVTASRTHYHAIAVSSHSESIVMLYTNQNVCLAISKAWRELKEWYPSRSVTHYLSLLVWMVSPRIWTKNVTIC